MAITLEQARERINDCVIYQASHSGARIEEGVITSVNHRFVFVRFNNANMNGQACDPENLRLTNE